MDPETSSMSGAMGAGMVIVWIVVVAFYVACQWKLFVKAGKPGWAAIIPIYNCVVYLQIINRPVWWLALFLVPVLNIVIAIIMVIDLAKSFGKSGGYAAGMILLGFVFFPMLAFGSSTYTQIQRPSKVA